MALKTADEGIFKDVESLRQLTQGKLLNEDRTVTSDGYRLHTITVKEHAEKVYSLSFGVDNSPCFLYKDAIILTGADDAMSRHSQQRIGAVSTNEVVAGLVTDMDKRHCLRGVSKFLVRERIEHQFYWGSNVYESDGAGRNPQLCQQRPVMRNHNG